MDTPPEQEFDALVKAAAAVCGVPISLISLVDQDRQWFKANVGLPGVTQTPREHAFCAHAILGQDLMEVTDAQKDERFADNPLVAGTPDIRFYAGAPLQLKDGSNAGTLCVIDREPRTLTAQQREVLKLLAAAAVHSLEGRRAILTERKLHLEIAQSAAGLLESESRFRALSEVSPLGVFATDAMGAYRYTNARWQEIYGLKHDESLGDGWTKTLHPDNRDAVFALWLQTAKGKKDFDAEFRIVRKQGDIRTVHVRARPKLDTAGTVTGYIGCSEDITDRKAVQSTAETLMHAIQTNFISSVTDERGIITEVSDSFCAISGFTREELIGSDHRIVNSGRNGEGFFARMWSTLLTGQSWRGEICNRTKDGRYYWVDSCISPLPGAGGTVRGYVSIRTDITHRIQQEEALRQSEQRLQRTGKVAQVGGWELDLTTGELVWSGQTHVIHGVPEGYVPDVSKAINFYAPEARPVIQSAVETAMASGQSWDLELPFIKADGTRIWVRAVGTAEFLDGKPIRLVGTFQDVSKLHEMNAELTQQHELLRVTLQSIGDAVITTDASGSVSWLNPVAERMTGWQSQDAIGCPIEKVFHIVNEETRLSTENPVATCLKQGRITGLANHTVLISRQGVEFGIEDSAAPIRSETGEILGAVLVFHDVTEQRRLSGEMNFRATHDALTGLVNRTEFETRLRNLLNQAHEDKGRHAMLFIDLDQFKIVNDTCGHAVGDQLLQQVSKLLSDVVRSRDTLARLGGDEFAVILEHCTTEHAMRVGQQICERMDDFRFTHDGRRFRIGASIGLVPVDERWGTMAAVLQAADSSCYAAKEAGRNRVHTWYDTDMAIRARHGEMQWASRLEQALDENRFVLYAQKIEKLSSQSEGIHAEVLLRLSEQDGTLVLPGAFLPAAERFHLASRIDRWVLRHTIDFLHTHGNLDKFDTLSINLSGQSIGDRAFHRQAFEMLEQAGPSICKLLCIEITETAAITNMTDACLFISHARGLGLRIALDDFGAGASSFGYLKNLQIDLLKIDGQFIRDILENPLDEAAVRCFADVSKVINVETVAEFVDRVEVLERVKDMGIQYAQGFYIHKPEPLIQLVAQSAHRARRA